MLQISPSDFVFISGRSRYSLALFLSFICTYTILAKNNLHSKGSIGPLHPKSTRDDDCSMGPIILSFPVK